MPSVKRVAVLALAGVLITAGVRVERAYACGGGQRGYERDPGQARWGSEPAPSAGVCFYKDSNLRGEYFCVRAGEDLARLPEDMCDKISSLHVMGNVEVTVFKDDKFKGESARFLTDVRDLKKEGWNDRISSVRATNASIVWDRDRFPQWGRQESQQRPREGVCFYRDANFRGESFCVPRGASYAEVPPSFNDEISSIRVFGGGVMMFADRDFSGRTLRITSDTANLRQAGWNDKLSSIRVF